MPRSPSSLRLALSLSALGFACGGDVTLPNQGEPAALEIIEALARIDGRTAPWARPWVSR